MKSCSRPTSIKSCGVISVIGGRSSHASVNDTTACTPEKLTNKEKMQDDGKQQTKGFQFFQILALTGYGTLNDVFVDFLGLTRSDGKSWMKKNSQHCDSRHGHRAPNPHFDAVWSEKHKPKSCLPHGQYIGASRVPLQFSVAAQNRPKPTKRFFAVQRIKFQNLRGCC